MRALGFEIETMALNYLIEKNFHLIERNFRSRQGEIDLIGIHEGALVFVEVRYRKNLNFGTPQESILPNKIAKIKHTALYFLQKRSNFSKYSCRFDVIAITLKQCDYVVDWIKNAFN